MARDRYENEGRCPACGEYVEDVPACCREDRIKELEAALANTTAQVIAGAVYHASWLPIETAPEHVTVLTQHADDLYPVPAFRSGDAWLLEREGRPEDTDDKRPGKYGPLYRTPTHWMPLPDPPGAPRA